MDIIFYTFACLIFAAVIFLLEGVYSWWSSTRSEAAKRIERRLQLVSAGAHGNKEQLSILKQKYLDDSSTFERLLLQIPRAHSLDRLLEQSGLGWSVPKFFIVSTLVFMLGSMLAMFLWVPAAFSFLIGIPFATVPYVVLLQARNKRFKKFELQLPEAADLISRALRAGHAFPSTLQMVKDEMPEPISGEFRIAFDEINYGVPMNEALMNLTTRMPLTDLRYFIIAVLIQRESGGNLAEILENISAIIRERLKLLGRIRVLSAEGKLSAWILGLLPFAVGLVISFVNPEYMRVLWADPAGIMLIAFSAVMMVIGVILMRNIIRIRV
ncbi:type II secretion system F family protein [Oxalobacteraceae bacterium R-40]|uniref:Type II secretion system F family protein n=1 Tax=Keguizhuia sedimenti TaxID=3064264 RepID=A0ABU1BL86_9BURK|nr:type II secretion system F family protein [Oxalobacteraceae bacterium R-40]